MTRPNAFVLLFAGAAMLSVGACNKSANANNAAQNSSAAPVSTASNDPIASAESAAPAAVSHAAAVVVPQPDGTMKTLRNGRGVWTCMPDAPDTPGPDPMCFDTHAAQWIDAWLHHKTPPANNAGLMYMLEGGTDASNTDPYAPKATDQNNWIKTGPHIMIVGSADILKGYPSDAKPDTSAPYVMWAGTPYAHLMVPVGK